MRDQFAALGVSVGGMTYDKPEIIEAFDEKWDIDFPVLKDVDRQHVDAWGIRNQEYGPGIRLRYSLPRCSSYFSRGRNPWQMGKERLPIPGRLVRGTGGCHSHNE